VLEVAATVAELGVTLSAHVSREAGSEQAEKDPEECAVRASRTHAQIEAQSRSHVQYVYFDRASSRRSVRSFDRSFVRSIAGVDPTARAH
jgi:hypothetical protein